jgi:tripartite-type tricarboxylate transporter receptor subunit TctC
MKKSLYAILLSSILVVLSPYHKGLAAPYYEGKRITLTVGYAPGGGYDQMARLFAKHLTKYIPGKPVVIVENMPGAGGMVAANQFFNLAKPDGLRISALERSLAFAQLLKAPGAKYDVTKFCWIGSAAVEPAILTIRADLPYKTIDDLRAVKDLHLAAGGVGSSAYQFLVMSKDYLGLNYNIVIYGGGQSECLLAVERKEADGISGSYGGLQRYIGSGILHPVLRSRVKEQGIENVPVNQDLTQDQKAKTVMEIYSAVDLMGRPFAAPPGTPDNIVKVLREAFVKVTQDPEAKEQAKKFMMSLQYLPPDECLRLSNYIVNQPEEIARELGKYMKY